MTLPIPPSTRRPGPLPLPGAVGVRPAAQDPEVIDGEEDAFLEGAAPERTGLLESPPAAIPELHVWEPTPEDLAHLEKAIAAAQPDQLEAGQAYRARAYFTPPAARLDGAPNTEMYEALVQLIRTSDKIHAALYGIDQVPELVDELRAAIARGAEVKIVADTNADGTFTYPQTAELLEEFGPEVMRVEQGTVASILHHKFWIFDEQKVWTGSANINHTAIGKGYNNEVSVLFESKNLARIFEAEHAQLWAGRFHHAKQSVTPTELPLTETGVRLQAFFSPKQPALTEGVLPAIAAAKKSISLSLFHFSDKTLAQALVDAKANGVDVKVVIDSTGASNAATRAVIEILRAAKIQVVIENWGGKQHMKGGAIDGEVTIVGSLNWAASGAKKNDENCVIVHGDTELAEAFEKDILGKFEALPNLWEYGTPKAESLNSVGSLTDGEDNDYNQVTDPTLTWESYQAARGEIDRAATKMAQELGPAAAEKARQEALRILAEQVEEAGEHALSQAKGTPEHPAVEQALIAIRADLKGLYPFTLSI